MGKNGWSLLSTSPKCSDFFNRLNFTVLHDGDGSTKKVVELKEGGTLISVSQKNRAEYIKLRIEWELGTSIRGKLNAVRQGMMEVCDGVVFKVLN